MDKVWLVTCGEYSGYFIDKAFTSEAAADAYATHLNKEKFHSRCRVEDFDLDSEFDPERKYWQVEDGPPTTARETGYVPNHNDLGRVRVRQNLEARTKSLYVLITADTEEAAIKIAAEKFAQYKAEKAGIA